MEQALYNQTDTAAHAVTNLQLLHYYQNIGAIERPAATFNNRPYYTAEQLEKVKAFFNLLRECVTPRKLARLCNISYAMFDHHLYRGQIAAPSFVLGRRKYYTSEQAADIRRYFTRWRYNHKH